VLALSMANPTCGCVWLSDRLNMDGIGVSSPAVQVLLIKNGMGRPYRRVLKLEEKAAGEASELRRSRWQ